MDSGNVPSSFDSLAWGDSLESRLGETAGGHTETKTRELYLLGYILYGMLDMLRSYSRRSLSTLTSGKDGSLLNLSCIQNRASLEDLESTRASVGDASLDIGVANHLQLDRERCGTLSKVNRHCGRRSDEDR
jgi:hypothetical protein